MSTFYDPAHPLAPIVDTEQDVVVATFGNDSCGDKMEGVAHVVCFKTSWRCWLSEVDEAIIFLFIVFIIIIIIIVVVVTITSSIIVIIVIIGTASRWRLV